MAKRRLFVRQVIDTDFLAKMMKIRHLTQEELGSKAGLYQAHISMILSGEVRSPTYHTLRALAKALKVPIEHLTRSERKDEQKSGEGKRVTAENDPV